ncbi:hypothetical protein NLI96_g3965 [Meripilus lineatus]|uniref:Uncharacterized protein n=1 Tax=Meripilus lineatus TaxID=2056292 RepID=A0AAD5V7Z6_9APHY|nr:hypothetical protein NLI96_g3965 [Physisporinus lineatus]
MPTVPPTCRCLTSLKQEGIYLPGVNDQMDIPNVSVGPTPDPELDDIVLVSVVTGDGIGAITSVSTAVFDDQAFPDHSLVLSQQGLSLMQGPGVSARTKPEKPHLSIDDLSLHSPSSVLGTPFDASPKFEYPFPESFPDQQSGSAASHRDPSIPSTVSAFPIPLSFLTTSPVNLPASPVFEPRALVAVHPKLQTKDSPVPPSLSNKIWPNTVNAPGRPRSRTKSASIDATPLPLKSARSLELQRPPSRAGPVPTNAGRPGTSTGAFAGDRFEKSRTHGPLFTGPNESFAQASRRTSR